MSLSRFSFFLLCLVSVVAVSSRVSAGGTQWVPSYYGQADFLTESPGTAGGAAGAYVNPAVLGVLPGRDLQFFWTDQNLKTDGVSRWALLSAVPHLGLGVERFKTRVQIGSVLEDRTLTQYSLATGFGDEGFAVGFGHSWTTGDAAQMNRANTVSLGLLARPCRFASLSAVGTSAYQKGDTRLVADIGIRPLGTTFLTLLGDAEFMDHQSIDDLEWGAGLGSEILPGILVAGKVRKGGTYQLGVSVSFGSVEGSVQPHYDKDNNRTFNTYGLRSGYLQRNVVTDMTQKRKLYYKRAMKGQVGYQRFQFMDPVSHDLKRLLAQLEDVRQDDRYAGVALNLSDMQINYALAWELREKLKEIRSSGKKVVTFVDNIGMVNYYVASAADRVVMDPIGILEMGGLALNRTYYRQMFQKLGVGMQEWRFFTYKSAAETFARENMSEADREQRQALVDGWYAQMRKDVCEARKISPAQFDNIVNKEMVMLPKRAMELGLVDSLGHWLDAEKIVKGLEGEKGKRLVGPKRFEAQKYHKDEWGRPPEVALIYGLGLCAMDEGITARKLGNVVKGAGKSKRIKAIVFRADSPGGDALASEVVARELLEASKKKPVIVTQGMVSASGGYWISMYGDTIVATPMTITGSIGVIGFWAWNDGFGGKIGLTSDHVQKGDHADLPLGIVLPFVGMALPDRNLTSDEYAKMKDLILTAYDEFLERVGSGRGMAKADVDKVGQGRVWTGTAGKEKGLVDEIGGLERAMVIAREAAGISKERTVFIRELPGRGFINPQAFDFSPIKAQADSYELQYIRKLLEAKGRPVYMVPPDLIVEK
ncbi:MAG: S49 family peptidase [Candidatus Eisenbacteria bacterium]|nr:S49 family peptidase [Candidatus Eisenbacteria bacterium]